MIRRAPTQRDGRPVRIETLPTGLPEKKDYDSAWNVILSKKGDGKWYRLRADWPECKALDRIKALERLYNGLDKRMRDYGWSAKELTVMVTEVDGLVFRWYAGDVAELDELTEPRIRERRDRRNERLKVKRREKGGVV